MADSVNLFAQPHKEFYSMDMGVFWVVVGLIGFPAVVLWVRNYDDDVSRRASQTASLLSRREIQSKSTPDGLFKKLVEYFTEKTWGASGLRWTVITADKERRKIVADIKFQDIQGTYSSATVVTDVPIGENSSLTLSNTARTGPKIKSRYALITVHINQEGSQTKATVDWEFRYSEKSREPNSLPLVMYDICNDVLIQASKASHDDSRTIAQSEAAKVSESLEKKCPDCAEYIKKEARKCRFCGVVQTEAPS